MKSASLCWLSSAISIIALSAATAAAEPVVAPEPSEAALRYYESGILWWWVGRTLTFGVPALWLFSGAAAKLGERADRMGRYWPISLALFFAAYQVVESLLRLPFRYFAGFARDHAYELSDQSLTKWLTDSALDLGVNVVLGVALLWIPWWAIRKLPRRWWLAWTAGAVPFAIAAVWLQPLFIAPLFNDFGPMQDKQLEARILALADRAGIEGGRVFEVAKSEDTRKVNAYVTGFGSSKRIVLWDTLLAQLEEDEVLVVMGHEMGHYALNHVLAGIARYSLLAGLGFAFLYWVGGAALRTFGERWGIRALHEPAALPLLVLLGSAFMFLAAPVQLAVSRSIEHEADRFTLELTRSNDACARAFLALQQSNLSNPRPGPLFTLWRMSHPSIGDRVDFCNDYRPWAEGEPLRYAPLFREGS
jgi:Zn-dependent protease with chaperone function